MRVAFVGTAGSGKTWACRYLQSQVGGKCLSFATPVKHEVFEFLRDFRLFINLSNRLTNKYSEVYSDRKRPSAGDISLPPLSIEFDSQRALDWINYHKSEVRSLLQYWGTDYRRAKDQNYWIKKLTPELNTEDNIFVDDCRFLNEASFLQNMGFILVGIRPVNFEKKDGHASETELFEIWDQYKLPIIVNKFDGKLPDEVAGILELEEISKA